MRAWVHALVCPDCLHVSTTSKHVPDTPCLSAHHLDCQLLAQQLRTPHQPPLQQHAWTSGESLPSAHHAAQLLYPLQGSTNLN